ncbi:MAG: flagellar export chaperone FlgN [Planctomycetota bacterium]|nr:flagellar export chaperone FlgN [Planctomycetota bacterium]
MSETHTATRDWAEALIELLERQETVVNELAALARQQAELIRQSRTDALLGLLTRRQQLIERFAGAQDELGRLTADLERRLETVSDEQRERIQMLLTDISGRLAQVMQRDEEDQQVLEAARNRTKDELAAVGTTRQARRAYLGGRGPENRFADRRG